MNIYVGNLPYSTGDKELEDIFKVYGQVKSAKVISDRETGRSKGFGFIEMDGDEEGMKAIEELEGSEVDGRNLRVNEAKPKKEFTRN